MALFIHQNLNSYIARTFSKKKKKKEKKENKEVTSFFKSKLFSSSQ